MKRNSNTPLVKLYRHFYVHLGDMPNNTCDYVPRLLFMLIFFIPYYVFTFPVWIHYWIDKYRDKMEENENYLDFIDYDSWIALKMAIFYNFVVFGLISTILHHTIYDSKVDLDTTPIIISGLALVFTAIVALLLIGIIAGLIVMGGDSAFDWYKNNYIKKDKEEDKGPSAFSIWIKNIKEKTCTPIEWTDE